MQAGQVPLGLSRSGTAREGSARPPQPGDRDLLRRRPGEQQGRAVPGAAQAQGTLSPLSQRAWPRCVLVSPRRAHRAAVGAQGHLPGRLPHAAGQQVPRAHRAHLPPGPPALPAHPRQAGLRPARTAPPGLRFQPPRGQQAGRKGLPWVGRGAALSGSQHPAGPGTRLGQRTRCEQDQSEGPARGGGSAEPGRKRRGATPALPPPGLRRGASVSPQA